jgi:hypothetical protein
MHKGAILDVHIVRSGRIGIHAGLAADSRRRSARRMPAGSEKHRDPAVTLRSVGLLVILRAIWPSAFFAEANGLRGLLGSQGEPWLGLLHRLHGSVAARTQPIARSIARPGGCCQCDN